MKPTSRHRAIDYVEFSVIDLAEAKRFYAAAFDWTFNDYGPAYAGIQGDGREVGGVTQVDHVARGEPLVVLYSSDLYATLARVRGAGGEIVKEPFEFPGGGDDFILRTRPLTNQPCGRSGDQQELP